MYNKMSINIDLNNDNIQYLTILNEIENNNKNNFLNYILNLGFNEYIKLKNIHFNKDFNFNIEVYLGLNDGGGADGMAIVFHNDPNGINAVGTSGSGLGASGIRNGISIEFDTWDNGEMAQDHTHIKLTQSWGDLTTMKALTNIEDGKWHLVNFNWNASTQTLSYSIDGNLIETYTNDLVSTIFNNESNMGLTIS